MDRFEAMTLFVRIVESGSFTKAANGLDIPRATATLAIQRMESRLGVRLLERTTRQVRPTPEGKAFHERCVRLLAELEDAEATLKPAADNPDGVLRVEMHGAQARLIVLPRIQEFHRRYPRLELILTSGDRFVDLVGEGVDCALRSGAPADSSLVARKLAEMPQTICASPAYLENAGYPRHPGELHKHQVVNFFSGNNATDSTLDVIVDGRSRAFEVGGWITVNDASTYVESGRQGCGMIQLPRFHVAPLIERGELVEVLPEWSKPSLPLHAVYPQRRQLSPRVRVFLDWIASIYAARSGA
ncbi:LysR family transcriptional regulator [Halomonas eurihalina]|uniref:LysR family transcriptional regulator n=1 Tax=Halomonas eurihalina TaxID=42566 RepID=A0A5D9CN12_HALER|nr:LysR family transcriptional regulator [Halomonas eurihalina]MDR5860474.1 LysR family transcriptional regulator [Halomonas eurihalina]TZG32816.1 LysR family transcriptional regulator [Halomonas eurihalina]